MPSFRYLYNADVIIRYSANNGNFSKIIFYKITTKMSSYLHLFSQEQYLFNNYYFWSNGFKNIYFLFIVLKNRGPCLFLGISLIHILYSQLYIIWYSLNWLYSFFLTILLLRVIVAIWFDENVDSIALYFYCII